MVATPRCQTGSVTDLKFPPVANGLDYIESVVEHLSGTPTPRDLKYAILHASAATEVLLKARLAQEHWSLVFEKPDSANRESFDNGNFRSVGLASAIKRLKSIGDVSIDDQHARTIRAVADRRNRLQHHGLTDNVYSVQALANGALSFLFTFIATHLRSGETAAAIDDTLSRVRDSLDRLAKFVDERNAEIRAGLTGSTVVSCPVCQQAALVPGERECRFCLVELHDEEAATRYVTDVLQLSEYEVVKDGGEWPIHWCPVCDSQALVGGADSSDEQAAWICFSCGEVWAEEAIDSCTRCGVPYVYEEGGIPMCGACWDHLLASE